MSKTLEDSVKESTKDLGQVIGKVVDQIGASNGIALYNIYALKVKETGRDYDEKTYIKVCERYLSLMIQVHNITPESNLLDLWIKENYVSDSEDDYDGQIL